METNVNSEREMRALGARLGSLLQGGEVIQLIGDVGAGKTTLVKAIASGMGITDDVGSPSYTLGQIYEAPYGLRLVHYDFYRLDDPGILANELEEVTDDQRAVVVIEWGAIVSGVLPADHLQIHILPTSETARQITISAGGPLSKRILESLS